MNFGHQRNKKEPLTLKRFRLWLIARDSSIAQFARENKKSRAAIYGAFKQPNLFPVTRELMEEAFYA